MGRLARGTTTRHTENRREVTVLALLHFVRSVRAPDTPLTSPTPLSLPQTQAGNALATPLVLLVSMDGGGHLPSSDPFERLPPII